MGDAKVLLVGGAPGVGKTTLGRALAAHVDATSLSVDDLLAAAKAVTTPDTHPGLHAMSVGNHVDYYTTSSIDRLKADAAAQHEATWPAIEKVIRNHATWGSPIVIDGWALLPRKVAALDLENVASFWLVADPAVLEERERRNEEFLGESPDPERMLENFLGRSLWHQGVIEQEAAQLKMNVLRQNGEVSVEELRDAALARC